ncbi:hypothetical protein [Glycomyces tenuis]|uniref:TPR repeat region-containing protein n=1 Tax=Glycomyces tenuis TaxID=58116 RepID=UPI000421EC54|nr:hypothetical protein [Glycomyces tenuis]
MPSIPTIGSFDPPTTTADEGALQDQAQTLQDHSGRIIGRGTDVMQQMNTTAVDFSELVAEPLKTHGGFSLTASEKAMEGAVWGSTTTRQWATDVATFKRTIADLETEWAAAVADKFGTPPDATEAQIAAAGQQKLNDVNGRANTAYELFKEHATTAGSMLKGGPTPENLQALAAAGGGSWATFNMFGTQAGPPPVTGAQGAALAQLLRDRLASGDLDLDLFRQIRTMLRGVAEGAQVLQEVGGQLTAGQLGFLEQFYAGLEGPLMAQGPDQLDLLYRLPDLLEGRDIAPAAQNMVLAAVGGGLLALSDKRIGGGADRLPESMRPLMDRYFGGGYEPGTVMGGGVTDRLHGLAQMFGATADYGLDRLEGGEELSAALTFAVADANAGGFYYQPEHADLIDLIEVGTRNTDANLAMLTGGIQHPAHPATPERPAATPEYLVRNVLGAKWDDQGAAAAGLVNWLGDPKITEQYGDEATKATYNLITAATNRDPAGWDGPSTYEVLTDGFGSIGAYEAAPLGVANPHIAQAMSRIAVNNLPYFDDADTGGPSQLTLSSDPKVDDMYLSLQSREDFFELAMGDQTGADLLGESVYTTILEDARYAGQWEDLAEAETHGENAGTLARLLDTGVQRLAADAQADADATTTSNTKQAAWFRAAAAAFKELIPIGRLGSATGTAAKQLLEAPKWAPGAMAAEGWVWGSGQTPDGTQVGTRIDYESVKLGSTHAVVEQLLADPDSGVDIDDVRAVDSRLLDEHGQLRSADVLLTENFPPTEEDHEGNMRNREAREYLERVIAEACDEQVGPNLDEFVKTFIDRRANN